MSARLPSKTRAALGAAIVLMSTAACAGAQPTSAAYATNQVTYRQGFDTYAPSSARPRWMNLAPFDNRAGGAHIAVAQFGGSTAPGFVLTTKITSLRATCEPASSTNGIAIDRLEICGCPMDAPIPPPSTRPTAAARS